MAIVYGQIESLCRLKEELHRHGIHRFNSIAEIEDFKKAYAAERQAFLNHGLNEYSKEFNRLDQQKIKLQVKYHATAKEVEEKLNANIQRIESKVKRDKEIYLDHALKDFAHWIKTLAARFYLFLLKTFSNLIIWIKTYKYKSSYEDAKREGRSLCSE